MGMNASDGWDTFRFHSLHNHRFHPRGGAMFVVKRDGRKEPVHFDKITARITKLSYGLNTDFCDPVRFEATKSDAGNPKRKEVEAGARRLVGGADGGERCTTTTTQVLVAQKVTTGVYKGVTTTELDELAAETAASMTAKHPDYALVREGNEGHLRKGFLKRDPELTWKRPRVVHPAAGCSNCRVQPAQEHAQVLHRNVRKKPARDEKWWARRNGTADDQTALSTA